MRSRTIVTTLILALLLVGANLYGQNVVNGPPPAAQAKADAPKETLPNVPLTEIELLKVENSGLKADRLTLQIKELQSQVTTAQNQLTSETSKMNEDILRAHSLDASKYHVDAMAKACVPNGAPTPPKPIGSTTPNAARPTRLSPPPHSIPTRKGTPGDLVKK